MCTSYMYIECVCAYALVCKWVCRHVSACMCKVCKCAIAHLREVPHYMAAMLVNLSQDVKQEWLHIKVECLVIQKQFGHQTKILAVNLMIASIHFKY